MKKYLVLALSSLLFACSSSKDLQNEYVTYEPQTACAFSEPFEMTNCGCNVQAEPFVEIKHPRIVEEMTPHKARRNCPSEKVEDCGCPFEGQKEVIEQPKTYVPAQIEAYTLLSNRAFNRFIKDTYAIYSQTPNLKLYMEKPVLKAEDLPAGFEKGFEAFKTQIKNSHSFELTEDENEADYTLSTTIDWLDTPSKDVPAIRYVVDLYAKDKTDAGSWSNVVKKADHKSWL